MCDQADVGSQASDRGRHRRAAFLLVLLAVACTRRREPADAAVDLAPAVVERYAEVALATYTAALQAARALRAAVDSFTAAPDAAGLKAARQAWRASRIPYAQTEVFRFYDGPVDRVEPLLNAWPVDESYIEQVVADAKVHPTVDAALLVALNEKEGEKNVSAGFHAVEFLLWGADEDDQGPGARPLTDYTDDARGAARRRQYLRVATGLLVRHLEEVVAAWTPAGAEGWRARLAVMPPERAVGLILKGMGTLAGPELGGERLTVPYETKDQENEHSCFSDNTHEDLVFDLVGIENVFLGRVPGGGTGPGLRELLARKNAALADELAGAVSAALAAARAVPPPFDRALVGADDAPGRQALKRTITAVEALADALTRAAAVLDVRITIDDPKAR